MGRVFKCAVNSVALEKGPHQKQIIAKKLLAGGISLEKISQATFPSLDELPLLEKD